MTNVTPEPPAVGVGEEPQRRFIGIIRAIRAEAQNLRRSLDDVRATEQIPEAPTRETAVHKVLADAAPIFEFNRGHIEQLLTAAAELMDGNARLFVSLGDELVHISNSWERASQAWPQPPADADAVDVAEIARRGALAARHLDELIYHAALVTIPERVGEQVNRLRIGGVLDFDQAFSDELPDADQRGRLLRYVNAHPGSIEGIVDVRRGVIYRAAKGAGRRLVSYIVELGVVVLGGGLVYLLANAGNLVQVDDWPVRPDQGDDLLAAYVFLLLGAAAHILVDALKQARAANRPSFLAIHDLPLWAHVKESTIVASVLYLWLGLIVLAFTTDNVAWQSAFFIGYSIDSFVDLFLQRFTRVATSSAEAIKGTLG